MTLSVALGDKNPSLVSAILLKQMPCAEDLQLDFHLDATFPTTEISDSKRLLGIPLV